MWNDKAALFSYIQARRETGSKVKICREKIMHMDLRCADFSNIDFSWTDFEDVCLDDADFTGANLSNARFSHISMQRVKLIGAKVCAANLRYCNLTGAHAEGADLENANFEFACMKHITSDEKTRFFRMYCPAEGPFLGYKKCCNDRLVQLLIPADAKRVSATSRACRCNKAKVLTIKSFDYTQSYEEAWSLVDENFVYRKGQWVQADDFNEDRWMESTRGIHFWMTREEAKKY